MTDLTDRLRATGIKACAEYVRESTSPDGTRYTIVGVSKADAAIAALLDGQTHTIEVLNECQAEMGRQCARAEQAEADARGWADSFKQAEQSIVELQAEVERLKELLCLGNLQAAALFKDRARLDDEVERLKWMLDDICARADTGTMYGPMPWVSRDEMLADLAARYEKEQHGTA